MKRRLLDSSHTILSPASCPFPHPCRFCCHQQVEHGDSVGNRGVIGPGDVQWMTAARGIIHEEFHSTEFAKEGGKEEKNSEGS